MFNLVIQLTRDLPTKAIIWSVAMLSGTCPHHWSRYKLGHAGMPEVTKLIYALRVDAEILPPLVTSKTQ